MFFYINPKSGDKRGTILLSGIQSVYTFEKLGKVYTIDVTNSIKKEESFVQLKEFQSKL